ncbi:putative RING-H2 finger protein ATL49, partial [Phalaenopsis equestris]|uniref:putative RING-H2 finger protein ATL49 n=1 Tax=Phalaenopsis equestris TaxID=78828 RepID=UPI0009E387D4
QILCFPLIKNYIFSLTIIILSIIFFICGIFHILLKPISSESKEIATASTFQGPLQQLFHLHDEGVDQYLIDTLPIFLYKTIIGFKDLFHCVVCLCVFELDDKRRLLPNCSHAFHVQCIDTWLLSHSTCPLCWQSLLLHECSTKLSGDYNSNVEDDFACKVEDKLNLQYVKLGKFRNVEVGNEGMSKGNCELKERCFSKRAIEYVMNESTVLQVAIKRLKNEPNGINDGGSARNIGDKCNKESFT